MNANTIIMLERLDKLKYYDRTKFGCSLVLSTTATDKIKYYNSYHIRAPFLWFSGLSPYLWTYVSRTNGSGTVYK